MTLGNQKLKVILQGGLGNQLFTYTAALWLASQHGLSVSVDASRARLESQGSIFDLHLGLSESDRKRSSRVRRLRLFRRRLPTLSPETAPGNSDKKHQRRTYFGKPGYDPDLSKAAGFAEISGYFQTSKYFEQLLEDPGYRKQFAKLTEGAETPAPSTVHLHIRRGDFTTRRHRLLSIDYYRDALSLATLGRKKNSFEVIVFSDDPTSARDALWALMPEYSLRFRDASDPQLAASEMIALSRARTIILSNSTFSWWAAALSEPDTVVTAPHQWLCGDSLEDNLYPAGWHTVKARWLCELDGHEPRVWSSEP